MECLDRWWRRRSALVGRLTQREAVVHATDGDLVAIAQSLTSDAPAVDLYAVGTVQVLDHRVDRADQDHRVVAADELRFELQVVVGRTPDAGLAAEHVHDFAPVLAVDQQPGRAIGRLGGDALLARRLLAV